MKDKILFSVVLVMMFLLLLILIIYINMHNINIIYVAISALIIFTIVFYFGNKVSRNFEKSEYESKDIPDLKVNKDIFDTIFDIKGCLNLQLPDINILVNNTIKKSNSKNVKEVADKIVNFYLERGLIIEYRGYESSIKLDTLKFKDIQTTSNKPIKITDITKYSTDLARTLKLSLNDLKFLEVIPGEDVFGIVIPSQIENNVRIKNIFEDIEFQKDIQEKQIIVEDDCYLNSVPIILGADSKGYVYFDMVNEPHALIAGASGSGKSVCINTILTSLLMLHTEKTLHFYLADLKDGIELFDYQSLPHVKRFCDTNDDVINMLHDLEKIMSERFKKIRPYKSIVEYNSAIKKKENFIPYIIVVLDEFITLSNNSDANEYLIQLSAKARAAGIFLILSTQKPTKNVIDTRIKANLNARISFRTTDEIESRIVLDTGEAAELRGQGDGILKTSKYTKRFQGCFVDRKETAKILNFWKNT